MKFEFYHESLNGVPKLAVDGIVADAIHFSHWRGNTTEPSVKADTSTEIALNVAGHRHREELTRGIELVTNNHFDTDGLLSVWTFLNGEDALDCRDELIAAAEAGDFSEFSSVDAIRSSIVIQGSEFSIPDDGLCAPLAREMNDGRPVSEMSAYHLMLPEVRDVIENPSRYERLWLDDWIKIETSLDSFASGRSSVINFDDGELSLVMLDPAIYTHSGFTPTRHIAPYTAISHFAQGNMYLIAVPNKDGWWYRIDYPYYSWAETVVRPKIERLDISGLAGNLNAEEPQKENGGLWQIDDTELASALKFRGTDTATPISHIDPRRVADLVRNYLARDKRSEN